MRATEYVHGVLANHLKPGDWAVDATVGNGHDTGFLARQVGTEGRVFGFDIQTAAISSAEMQFSDNPAVVLFCEGHEEMLDHLPSDAVGRIAAVMFNLGYLPGGDKSIVTKPETTVGALMQSIRLLCPGGLITIVVYRGHPGGEAEADAVTGFLNSLPEEFRKCWHLRATTQRPGPEAVVVRSPG